MAVHPKITLAGLVVGGAVGGGLVLFMLGRMTAGEQLTSLLLGIGAGIGVVSLVAIGLLRYLPSSTRMQGVLHQSAQPSDEGYVSALPRRELVGKTGIAESELRPSGVAEIEGERVDVTTDGEWLPKGTAVKVVKAEAMRVVVRRAPQITA